MKLNLLLFGIVILGAVSCKKYENGPYFSFISKTERLSNNWQIEFYSVNNMDMTYLVSNYSERFTKDKSYSYHWGILNGSGSWKFQNHYKEIKLTGNDEQCSRTLIISRLEEDKLWYSYTIGNNQYEVHLISM